MTTSRLASMLLLLVLVTLAAGCSGDDDGSRSDGTGRDAGSNEQGDEDEPRAGTPEAAQERTAGSGFALTPEISDCMEQAGFTQDAPPTGGLAAWRHPSGARIVVGSGPEVTLGIASEIGTAERPADVNGSVVIAADTAQAGAASACLD